MGEEVQFLQRMGSGSVQGLIKRLGLISRVFQESPQGEQGGGRGLLKWPANFVLQLLTGEGSGELFALARRATWKQ